jgi:hypothetical protein
MAVRSMIHNPLFRFGFRALFLFVMGYGLFMTVDACRRPKNQYPKGPKWAWCLILILSNPLIPVILREHWLFSLEPFLITSICYHLLVRRRHPIQRDRREA